jgi:hypothetical protein
MITDKYNVTHYLWMAIASIILQSVYANAFASCGTVERSVSALELSRALYPGLKGKDLRLTISDGWLVGPEGTTDARAFRLTFEKSTSSDKEKANSDPSPTNDREFGTEAEDVPLSIQFRFDTAAAKNDAMCAPVALMILSDNDRLQSAEELAIQHPKWSDDDLISALKGRGLEFGPQDKAALMKHLPLRQLRSYYGPLRIREVKFILLNDEQRKLLGKHFMELQWYLDITEVRTKQNLAINVDAFTGRIRGLAETPGGKTRSLAP